MEMAATGSPSAVSAADVAPPSTPSAPPHPDTCNYKGLLQQWTVKNGKNYPQYTFASMGGGGHQLLFSSTIKVCDTTYTSKEFHSRKKEAEQDAAKVAYEMLLQQWPVKDADADADAEQDAEQDVPTDVSELHDLGVPCVSILNELYAKTKDIPPSYEFVTSVLFAGETYTGEAAINEKDAKENAAIAAVKSLLATKNTCLNEIIRSKKHLIKSYRLNKAPRGGVDINLEDDPSSQAHQHEGKKLKI